jgi:hypothetical protein
VLPIFLALTITASAAIASRARRDTGARVLTES